MTARQFNSQHEDVAMPIDSIVVSYYPTIYAMLIEPDPALTKRRLEAGLQQQALVV